MDSHLESIPGLGTFTTGCLSSGDLEGLGRETDGALDAELLALGTLDELLADLLERLDFAGGQGDADLVSFLFGINISKKFWTKRKEVDKPGLRRTPSLAFGRTFCGENSFTTRTLQLRQSDEGDRCAVALSMGNERRRRDFGLFAVVGGSLGVALSEANRVGRRLLQPCCIVIFDWDDEEANSVTQTA